MSAHNPTLTHKHAFLPLALLASIPLLASCSNSSSSNLANKSLDKITGLWPSRVPVVDVRHKDLKKMASGKDRALAWDRSLNQWVYLPVDYKPPTLPDTQSMPVDGGILPPLTPGQDTLLEGQGAMPGE